MTIRLNLGLDPEGNLPDTTGYPCLSATYKLNERQKGKAAGRAEKLRKALILRRARRKMLRCDLSLVKLDTMCTWLVSLSNNQGTSAVDLSVIGLNDVCALTTVSQTPFHSIISN